MKTVFFILLALCFATGLHAQVPVLYYDFEANSNRGAAEAVPEQAITASSSPLYRSAYTGLTFMGTSGAGATYGGRNGTGLTANKWSTASADPGPSATEFFLFSTTTTGLSGLTLSFDAVKGSNASPNKIGVTWSIDSVLFFSATTSVQSLPATYGNLKFSLPVAAENKPKLYVRIYAFDAQNTNSFISIDNLTLSTAAITASNALLDYSALGVSLTSGTAFEPTYNNLTVSGAGTVVTLGGNLKLNGTLAMTAGTLSLASGSLSLSGTYSQGTGVINASSGTMIFNGSTAQTLVPGLFSGAAVSNLTINNNSGVTVTGDLTISNTLSLAAGTCSLGATTLSIGGNIQLGTGTLSAAAATLHVNGSVPQTIPAGVFKTSVNNLIINNPAGVTLAGNMSVGNNMVLRAGTFTLGTSALTLKGNLIREAGLTNASSASVTFNGNAAQNIDAGAFTGTIATLVINNNAGVTTAADMKVTATLILSGGIFKLNASTLTIVGNTSATVGTIDASAGSLVLNGTTPQTLLTGNSTTTVKNLTIDNAAGVTSNSATVITGNLTLATGTYTVDQAALTITGTIIRVGGIIDAAAGTLIFNGLEAQAIPGGAVKTAISGLTVNNANGVTINDNYTITAALALQAGSLVLNDKTVSIGGVIAGSGTFRGSETSALVIASASTTGTLNFDQTVDGTTNALSSLILNSGAVMLGGTLHIYTVLNVAGGTLDLAAKNLVMKSSAGNTARVAPVSGTINNATNVTVERWFPNDGRRWRMVSAGVNTTTSIRANWMEGGMNTAFCATCNFDPKPGYGTQITGAGGNANGFDATPSNSASLYSYNQSANGWTTVTSVNNTLSATTPYLIFLRGDRSVDMTANYTSQLLLPGSATILRATGALVTGTTNVSALADAGRTSFVSNPYPSPISWASIYANNSDRFENYYTYWEPKVGQRGAYVTVTNTGLKSNAGSAATEQIQSGQGFFVTTKAGTTAPSLTIGELDKATTANINVFKAQRKEQRIEKLYTSLNFTLATGEKFNADGVLVAYGPDYSNSLDANDAVQSGNWDEDIAIMREKQALSIETRTTLQDSDTIPLSIARLKTGVSYEWQFTPVDMVGHNQTGYLVDSYLKKETVISLTDTTYLPFSITNDPSSYMADRFMVVFRANSTLPLRFISVTALKANNGNISIEWQTTNESALDAYEVERSADGRSFTKISVVTPKGEAVNHYGIADETAETGDNFYRVKCIERDGTAKYSNVVRIRKEQQKSRLSVYPNPLRGTLLNCQISNLSPGTYTLQVKNSAGLLIDSRRFNWKGDAVQAIALPKTLPAGSYFITLVGQDRSEQTMLIKE